MRKVQSFGVHCAFWRMLRQNMKPLRRRLNFPWIYTDTCSESSNLLSGPQKHICVYTVCIYRERERDGEGEFLLAPARLSKCGMSKRSFPSRRRCGCIASPSRIVPRT